MSEREAFEAWWGEPFDEYDEDAIFALEVWQARDAEVAALEARIAELESLIRRCAPKLAEIMRMPNIEYVADAHNKAVKELRGVLR